MNLPNKLTLLRILLIPVFMVFAGLGDTTFGYLVAGVIFTLASITDFLDGHIARKHGLVTDFGKFADPLADKILTTAAFVYMMVDGICAPAALILILTREFAVSGVRMMAAGAKTGKVIAANMWGKLKTVAQMVVISANYFVRGGFALLAADGTMPEFLSLAFYILCWVVAALTVISGVQYIWGNRSYINTAK